jgi:hypothetical protein
MPRASAPTAGRTRQQTESDAPSTGRPRTARTSNSNERVQRSMAGRKRAVSVVSPCELSELRDEHLGLEPIAIAHHRVRRHINAPGLDREVLRAAHNQHSARTPDPHRVNQWPPRSTFSAAAARDLAAAVDCTHSPTSTPPAACNSPSSARAGAAHMRASATATSRRTTGGRTRAEPRANHAGRAHPAREGARGVEEQDGGVRRVAGAGRAVDAAVSERSGSGRRGRFRLCLGRRVCRGAGRW